MDGSSVLPFGSIKSYEREKMNKDRPLPLHLPCPECGGQRVEAKGNGYMYINKPSAGAASLFSGSPLRALVCTNCGYTTLYVKEPDKLRGG